MRTTKALALCLAMVAGCAVLGTALGAATALLLLQFAEGDGRGAPFLIIGFAMLAGAGLGLAGGVVWSFVVLRTRLATGESLPRAKGPTGDSI